MQREIKEVSSDGFADDPQIRLATIYQ